MRVKSFKWVGVGCADVPAMRRFCGDVLGLKVIKESNGGAFVEFELASGQRFEVFGERSSSFKLHQAPVVAFSVDDIDEARRELEAAGVEILTKTSKRAKEAYWFYFRAPDGFVYEIQQWNV
jgi:catechol 2,3-dioxygenase-like lactoylglutathione lyase family enzyme